MKQYLDSYGELPEIIGRIDIDVSEAEMCFVQYLPVLIPNQRGALPENLQWVDPILMRVLGDLISSGVSGVGKYIYLTVKRLYGSGNREGWHCDGFGTDDINYIWYDSHPTKFYAGDLIKLPKHHRNSILKMSEVLYKTNKLVEYPCKTLIRMNQSSIHRVNPEVFTGLRTFVKISFSDSKYNLKGNAHNHSLDYNWEMVERGADRNHPIGDKL